MPETILKVFREKFRILILILAACNGLVYVFLVPPWEHYDEPTHFEYAWLIAHLERLPEEGEYNQWMRREVAGSMYEHGFFKERNFYPNLLVVDEPVWLGISQTGDPPLYYLLASLPLRLIQYSDMTLQLYAARLVSFLIYLLTVYVVLLAGKAVFSEGHILSKMLPVFVVFLPSFVDIMTAVNNDAAVILFSTVFFWAAVRFLKREKQIRMLLWMLLATAGAVLSKNIGYAIVGLLAFTLLLGIRHRWIRIGLLAAGAVGAVLFVLLFVDFGTAPAFFYSQNYQKIPFRSESGQAVSGDYVFQLERKDQENERSKLIYHLNKPELSQIDTEVLTFGGYVWATTDLSTNVLDLYINDRLQKRILIDISGEATAFHDAIFFNEEISAVRIELQPRIDQDTVVSYDDLFLVAGTYADHQAGKPTNLIRNNSAESGWPHFDRRIARPIDNRLPVEINDFWGLLDWRSHLPYFRAAAARLLRSFWAVFDWGGVFLVGRAPYRFLGVVTAAGLSGVGLFGYLRRKQIRWELAALMAVSLALVWGAALLRGFSTSLTDYTYIPLARYAYPVILPTAILLVSGLFFWLRQIQKILRLPDSALLIGWLFVMIGLDLWAVYSIHVFYAVR